MKKVLLSGLFIASTLTAFAPKADAATIFLDDFTDSTATSIAITGTLTNTDVPGFPTTPPGGPANFVNFGLGNPQIEAGGLGQVPSITSRFITGLRKDGNGSNDVGIEVGSGAFDLNNGVGADSDITIIWDNRTTPAPGPGLNLNVPAGTQAFFIDVTGLDLGSTQNNPTATLIVNGLAAAAPVQIPLIGRYSWPASLLPQTISDVQLVIQGDLAYDIRIDAVGIEVTSTPEPSALLGLAAITSLAVFAKKGKA